MIGVSIRQQGWSQACSYMNAHPVLIIVIVIIIVTVWLFLTTAPPGPLPDALIPSSPEAAVLLPSHLLLDFIPNTRPHLTQKPTDGLDV